MRNILLSVATCLGFALTFSPGYSSTPDGVTPAMEDVCDPYTGAAYGLCTSYCEAMDCDDNPRASQKACTQVAAKFKARTGQAMPCGACPAGLVEPPYGVDFSCKRGVNLAEDAICIDPRNTNDVRVCDVNGCESVACTWQLAQLSE
jgi:hypothetical protein